MSKNSLQKAKEARKNPVLLGSTNQPAKKQPRTYSKVERTSVQSGESKHSEIAGHPNAPKQSKLKKALKKVVKKKDNK